MNRTGHVSSLPPPASRIAELERSLRAALQSAAVTRRQNSGYESNDTSFSIDNMIEPPEEEIEVEVISLQPIGPGLQTLEPDKIDGRTTPAFPVQGMFM